MADFKTITIDREIACSPDHLFHVMTDRDLRQKWSAPNDESVVIIDEYDCRAGGFEKTRCGPKKAPEFQTIGNFHVVNPEFLSFTETLAVQGETLSISLCSHEISGTDSGSALRVVLQVTSLAGPEIFENYAGGWSAALDNLIALAKSHPMN